MFKIRKKETMDKLNKLEEAWINENREKLYNSLIRIKKLVIKNLPKDKDDSDAVIDAFNIILEHVNPDARYLRVDGPKCLYPICKYDFMNISEEEKINLMLKDLKEKINDRGNEDE